MAGGKGGDGMEAVNLSKSYDGKPVLQGCSFRLKEGGRYALMGPSGSGKTTLLRLLMGLEKPDGGRVIAPKGLRISAVFQEDRLLEQMTAAANVCLAAPVTKEQAEKLLLRLGIEPESLSVPVSAYSGGMKRRTALCRALLAEYDVLFLDEPYKGLDEATRQIAMQIVVEMTAGKTVVLVTHDESEAAGYEKIQWK